MKRIEDYLLRHATDGGDKTAVVCGDERLTYRQLYDLARSKASLLAESEEKTVIASATPSTRFLITYFAAHLAGKAVVPLEKTTPHVRLDEIRRTLSSSEIPADVADILFTTGSTGTPKGVMLTHEAILANAENLISAQGYTNDHTFIVCGPLSHIGSLSKLWPMVVVGGTVIITQGLKDMEAFFAAIEDTVGKIATFLVPASLRMLMAVAKERLKGYAGQIDFIETGAAPMSEADMEELTRMLPGTRLYNTYASTETGIIATHDFSGGDCHAGLLGRPMRHSWVVIQSDGIVSCKGKTLMKGYVGDEELTRQVLRDGTLHTSDTGHLDEQGRLWLDGRLGDVINTGGYKVSPVEVENAAMSHPAVADCICTS